MSPRPFSSPLNLSGPGLGCLQPRVTAWRFGVVGLLKSSKIFSEEDEKNLFEESLTAFPEFTATLGGLWVLIFGLS